MAEPAGVTETITRTGPAPFAEPFLQYGMSEAQRLYQLGPYEYYPKETIAGFSPQTQQSLRMQEQMALAGTPVNTAAQQYATDVLSGTFLGGTPGLTEAINRAIDPVQARTTSMAAQRGRLGSGLAADVTSRAMGDVAADIAFRDYAAERNRQQQVLGMAPRLQEAAYYDAGILGNVGAIRDQRAQDIINADIQRYMFEQQAPAQALGQYQSFLSGQPGMGQSQTQAIPYFEPSKEQQVLGNYILSEELSDDPLTRYITTYLLSRD